MSKRILIVDDDALLRRSLAFNREQAGYHTSMTATAEDALAQVSRDPPDLALLDIGLPEMDGLDALRRLRQQARLHGQKDVPVIFLTARRRELDQIVGLELGADDYVTKPFDVDVLLARIKALLRRTRAAPDRETTLGPLTIGDLTMDPLAHTVTVGKRKVDLAPREFDLLYTLAQEAGRVIAMDDLLACVWGQSMRASRRLSTCTSADCVRNWRTTQTVPAASSPCAAWDTNWSPSREAPDALTAHPSHPQPRAAPVGGHPPGGNHPGVSVRDPCAVGRAFRRT
jgi:DNA-binding response OmpR family regulator